MSLTMASWVQFFAWFGVGMLVYFGYGIRNSIENEENKIRNAIFPSFQKSNKQFEFQSFRDDQFSSKSTVVSVTSF